jgi:hypothetical protein
MLTKEQITKLVEDTADIGALQAIARSLSADVRNIILPIINKKITDLAKQQGLKQVRSVIIEKDVLIKDWLTKSLPELYVAGINSATKDAKRLGITIEGNITVRNVTVELLKSEADLRPHLEAVNALLSNAYLDFANGMNGVVRGAERFINEASKQQIRLGIAQGQLTGQDVKTVAETIADTIGQQGFTALIDRGGRQWEIEQYSEMLARTHLIRSSTEGTINRAGDFGVDLMQVSAHGATDELCAGEEGKIYSISGNSDKYPPLAGHEPPFHPNCRHTLEMVVQVDGN